MANVQEYKCPCCGGALEFNSSSQNVKCPYCDTEFEVDVLAQCEEATREEVTDDLNIQMSSNEEFQADEAEGLQICICNSCGGQIIGDENTASISCPYCDSPIVVKGNLAGDLKPDVIIPFKVDKKRAKELLKEHYKGKKLLPKVFKDENHLDEMKGIYVPFWLVDMDADASIRYNATRTKVWTSGKYRYTKTSHYMLTRNGSISFSGIPFDGSSNMPDDLMESIEPFHYKDAVEFKTPYLAGYLADRYDVAVDEGNARINERIKASVSEEFRKTTVGYDSVVPTMTNVHTDNGVVKYALCPVWILNTNWKDKKYTFAVNGQTGKLVGDLPCDKGLVRAWRFKLTGIFGLIVFIISMLIL